MATVVSLLLTWFVLALTHVDFKDSRGHAVFGVHGVDGSSSTSRLGDGTPKSDTLIRNTVYGEVRGTLRTLYFLAGRQVERYLGIPYASPPVGELRFEVPVPPKHWSGVRDARTVPKACPQTNWALRYVQKHVPEFKSGDMDEDCLYLNVYVPALATPLRMQKKEEKEEEEEGLPVLIHVHGGSNEVGMGAMFHGDVLASLADVIVVTFNYRLGVFGFLSGHSPDFPGNYGLHDQIEAFRWVSENIRYFGGNPAKVTIQGHSAGANDVGQHVISPLSKGLFRNVVIMSGSPLAYWAINPATEASVSATRQLAADLGCTQGGWTASMADVKSCLKDQTWQNLNSARFNYLPGMIGFAPVVDGRLVPETPERSLTQLPLNGHAFMTGVTRDEASSSARMVEKYARKKRIPFYFDEHFTEVYKLEPFRLFGNVANFGRLVYHEYNCWEDPHNTTASLISVSHVMGDPTFVAPAVKLAQLLSASSKHVYFYSFDHVSRLSKDPQWMGVPHGRDLFYLFGCPLSSHPLHRYTELDRNISRAIIDIWSNFVRHGRPFQSSVLDKPFPVFDERNQSYFVIASDGSDVSIRTGRRLRAKQVAFWNSLLPTLRKPTSDSRSAFETLTWVFVALTSALLVAVAVLAICVFYFKKLARERCVVHATDEKNACQV
ncbi:pyrethroid hydrolase Ces2e-like [Babylonia areolata]|uniref:pyrethroid hydrolase Ces2e-like n=1 Tax=Babylonia areolata TaxID=304850 RepID=UPI003FD2288D